MSNTENTWVAFEDDAPDEGRWIWLGNEERFDQEPRKFIGIAHPRWTHWQYAIPNGLPSEERVAGTYAEESFGTGQCLDILYKTTPEIEQLVRDGFLEEPDPLDMHSTFDPETGRVETTFKIRPHDEEEARRIAAAINADTTHPGTAEVVDGCLRQNGVQEPRSVRLVPDDDGLPPLADGSRWDGEWLIEGECDQEPSTRHCLHKYGGGDWCLMSDIEQPDAPDPPTVATLVYLLARHQRATGLVRDGVSDWWADRLREIRTRWESRRKHWKQNNGEFARGAEQQLGYVVGEIDAVIDELHRKGLC